MGHFYWTGLSSKQKLFSETSNLGNFSPCRVFSISVLTCLLMKLNINRRHKPAKKSIRQDSKDSQCCQWWPVHPFRKWNHEQRECLKRNGEVIYRFGKHGKTGDAWKPATICSTRVRKIVTQYKRWTGGAESFIGLVQVNHLLLLKLIQILVSNTIYYKMNNCRYIRIKNLWRLPVNLLFFSM